MENSINSKTRAVPKLSFHTSLRKSYSRTNPTRRLASGTHTPKLCAQHEPDTSMLSGKIPIQKSDTPIEKNVAKSNAQTKTNKSSIRTRRRNVPTFNLTTYNYRPSTSTIASITKQNNTITIEYKNNEGARKTKRNSNMEQSKQSNSLEVYKNKSNIEPDIIEIGIKNDPWKPNCLIKHSKIVPAFKSFMDFSKSVSLSIKEDVSMKSGKTISTKQSSAFKTSKTGEKQEPSVMELNINRQSQKSSLAIKNDYEKRMASSKNSSSKQSIQTPIHSTRILKNTTGKLSFNSSTKPRSDINSKSDSIAVSKSKIDSTVSKAKLKIETTNIPKLDALSKPNDSITKTVNNDITKPKMDAKSRPTKLNKCKNSNCISDTDSITKPNNKSNNGTVIKLKNDNSVVKSNSNSAKSKPNIIKQNPSVSPRSDVISGSKTAVTVKTDIKKSTNIKVIASHAVVKNRSGPIRKSNPPVVIMSRYQDIRPSSPASEQRKTKISEEYHTKNLENYRIRQKLLSQPSKINYTESLTLLLTGDFNFKGYPNHRNILQKYLSKHKRAVSGLITVAWASEDIELCKKATTMLCNTLVESQRKPKVKNKARVRCLRHMEKFHLLVESIHTLRKRFPKKEEEVNQMTGDVLNVAAAFCDTKPSIKQIGPISRLGVRFVVSLLCNKPNSNQMGHLFKIVNLLCNKRILRKWFSTKKFYDLICLNDVVSKHREVVFLILICMTRTEKTLSDMVQHKKVLYFVLGELTNGKSKTAAQKRFLLSMLHAAAQNENGYYIISNKEYMDKLHNHFTEMKSNDVDYSIQLYTLLNRMTGKSILPDVTKNADYLEHEHMQRGEVVQEDSDLSSEEDSDEEPKHKTSSDEDNEDDSGEKSTENKNDTKELKNDKTILESLSDMGVYFSEYDKNESSKGIKFKIYEETINPQVVPKVIEDKVGRIPIKNDLAFPDCLMLAPNTNPTESLPYKLPCEYLSDRLNYVRGVTSYADKPQVVYDLDEIKKNKNLCSESCVISGRLQFDSRFESGNLQKAIQIDKLEYELLINSDSSGFTGSWFYFRVSNMTPNVSYRLNIINFTSNRNHYNDGMQLLLFSTVEYIINKTGWKRGGEDIVCHGNQYTGKNKTKYHWSLSFSISTKHNCDTFFISSFYPYTYTRLMTFLAPLVNYKSKDIYVRMDNLCNTRYILNEVPLLTITAKPNSNSYSIPFEDRPIVFLTARVHPGESNSSWIMEGIIKTLLDESNEQAARARETFIFKIVPMLNPEGVIAGNTRLGLSGSDLNRCWKTPTKNLYPEIYYTKRLAYYAVKQMEKHIAAFIDIHGHRRRRGFFFYGCNPKCSWRSKDRLQPDKYIYLKFLPETILSLNSHLFLCNCSYDIDPNKEKTARVVMWRELDILNSYTLECSFHEGYKRKVLDNKIIQDMGKSVIDGLGKIAQYAYNYKKYLPTFGLDCRRAHRSKPKAESK